MKLVEVCERCGSPNACRYLRMCMRPTMARTRSPIGKLRNQRARR